VVREVFGFKQIWKQIEALDGVIDTRTQADLFLEMRRLLDRATRWFLHTRGGRLDVLGEQERFTANITALAASIPGLLRGAEADRFSEHKNRLIAKGVPAELSATVASALDVFSLLDIVEIATKTGKSPADVAKLYFEVSERFEVDRLLVRITGLERADRWSAHARSALRSDLYAALAALVYQVITYGGDWEQDNSEGVARTRSMLAEIVSDESVGLANLSVALRAIRTLVG
jgi:glutamate dehydrogenase